MKTYTTYAGAYRAAQGRPILRLLDDPTELFIVLPHMRTQLMAVGGRFGLCDGSISYMELSTKGKA
jgi:hypothetical protein